MISASTADLLIVAAASGAVGGLEITERFRDEPLKALGTLPALSYVAVNAAAGVLALLLLRLFDVQFGLTDSEEFQRWARVVAAGFGAVIVLRSTLFVASEGAGEREYGLGAFIERLLAQAEGRVRRRRGPDRADVSEKAADGLTYEGAKTALGALALGQLPTAPDSERRELAEAQATIDASPESDEVKLRLLCLAVLNFGGEKVLHRAAAQVKSAGE